MHTDTIFLKQIKTIINSPEGNDSDYSVRPTWSDGQSAYSSYITQSVETWDCEDGPPIQTVRKIAWKSALREILTIYQKRATTIAEFEEMGVNWWGAWADNQGTLGKSYAYQLAKVIDFPEGRFNQVDRVIWLLKNRPMDRRIITNMLNLEELNEMTLPPCAFMTMWSVSGDKLNLMLVQRSGDLLPAAGFGGINTIQYYFLLLMIAQVTGYKPGKFTHIVNNLHIYDRHMDIANKLQKNKSYPLPEVWVNPEITNFYDFTAEDIKLINYQWHEDIKNIPIAE